MAGGLAVTGPAAGQNAPDETAREAKRIECVVKAGRPLDFKPLTLGFTLSLLGKSALNLQKRAYDTIVYNYPLQHFLNHKEGVNLDDKEGMKKWLSRMNASGAGSSKIALVTRTAGDQYKGVPLMWASISENCSIDIEGHRNKLDISDVWLAKGYASGMVPATTTLKTFKPLEKCGRNASEAILSVGTGKSKKRRNCSPPGSGLMSG